MECRENEGYTGDHDDGPGFVWTSQGQHRSERYEGDTSAFHLPRSGLLSRISPEPYE